MKKSITRCFVISALIISCSKSGGGTGLLTTTVVESPQGNPIQMCLDQINIRKAKNSADCSTSPATVPIGSHLVANPPVVLPTTCLNGSLDEIKQSLTNQLANCSGKTAQELSQTFQFGCKLVTKQDYCVSANQQLLQIANAPKMTYAEFVKEAAAGFDWYQSNGRPDNSPPFKIGDTQFTAYFNPTGIDASSVQTSVYKWAVYAAPPGLSKVDPCAPNPPPGCGSDPVTNVPYHWCIENAGGTATMLPTREDVANGAFKGQGLELAWFKYLYDIESLMLEGSGALNLKMPDGSIQNVVLNYAGQNGHSNNLLGNVLKCEGKKISGSEAAYYAAHPDEAYTDTVHYNPSMIFYQRGTPYVGVDGIAITPHASIATDPTSIPTGTVTMLNIPVKGAGDACAGGNASSLAIAQDIGGAIKMAHVDRYTGVGPAAEAEANSANDPGQIWMIVPKGAGTVIPGCK